MVSIGDTFDFWGFASLAAGGFPSLPIPVECGCCGWMTRQMKMNTLYALVRAMPATENGKAHAMEDLTDRKTLPLRPAQRLLLALDQRFNSSAIQCRCASPSPARHLAHIHTPASRADRAHFRAYMAWYESDQQIPYWRNTSNVARCRSTRHWRVVINSSPQKRRTWRSLINHAHSSDLIGCIVTLETVVRTRCEVLHTLRSKTRQKIESISTSLLRGSI